MLTFALAAGPDIPRRVVAALADPCPPDLPMRVASHLCWSNPDGTVLVGAWQDDVELGMGSRWHDGAEGPTLYAGQLWPRGRPWGPGASWSSRLDAHLRRHPGTDVTADLRGIYTLVHLDAEGRGVVTSDPLGTHILYRAEAGSTVILSPRSRLAARLAGSAARDLLGAGWLAFCGFPVGPRTGFTAVEAVPMGVQADVSPTGVVLRPTTPPWRAACPADRDVLADETYADVTGAVHAALDHPVPRRVVELTGGRDSRLILAVLLDEGIADRFEYRTLGAPDLPDVVTARRLADRFGLHHERGHDPVHQERTTERRAHLRAAHPDRPLRELELRLNVGWWSCARNAWEIEPAAPPCGDRVTLNGQYGEAISLNFALTTDIRTHAGLRETLLARSKYGVAGIVRPDVLEQYRTDLLAAAYDGFTTEDEPYDVFDAFFLRHRVRRWFGTTQEADPFTRVLPLHTPAGVRLTFALDLQDRHLSWASRELYRRASSTLGDEPFTSSPWRTRPVPPREPEPPRPPPLPRVTDRVRRVHRPGRLRRAALERRRAFEAADVALMRRYLLDAPGSPVADLLDRASVARSLDRFPRLGQSSQKQLYGALSAAIWLTGDEIVLPPT